ncbi:MAG: hypothetical protein J6386_16755 [Candidatus Synoicihabitans palmerolidicus]|nr:hypothetical protein [Candidatus Synoicihabitans palmerolidicus]
MSSCYVALRRRPGWTARGVAAVLGRRESHAVVHRLTGKNEEEWLRALYEAGGRETEVQEGAITDVDGVGTEGLLPPVRLVETRLWIVDAAKRKPAERENPEIKGGGLGHGEFRTVDDTEVVWAALIEVTGLERAALSPELKLKQDLEFDSLMGLELQNELAKRWGEEPDFESHPPRGAKVWRN